MKDMNSHEVSWSICIISITESMTWCAEPGERQEKSWMSIDSKMCLSIFMTSHGAGRGCPAWSTANCGCRCFFIAPCYTVVWCLATSILVTEWAQHDFGLISLASFDPCKGIFPLPTNFPSASCCLWLRDLRLQGSVPPRWCSCRGCGTRRRTFPNTHLGNLKTLCSRGGSLTTWATTLFPPPLRQQEEEEDHHHHHHHQHQHQHHNQHQHHHQHQHQHHHQNLIIMINIIITIIITIIIIIIIISSHHIT